MPFKKGNIPWTTGKHLPEETRRKIGDAHRGKTVSEEARRKSSESHKGHVPSEETRRRLSIARKGHVVTEETREKIRKANTGKKHTIETRLKLSKSHKGEKSHKWKGGVSTENELFRKSVEYQLWREAVFARDGWTCVVCGYHTGCKPRRKLNTHHLKPFSDFPEFRTSIGNGVTLCELCHWKAHSKKDFQKIADILHKLFKGE